MENAFCSFCDDEAIAFVEWKNKQGETLKTFFCSSCQDAFDFGQTTEEQSQPLD